MLEHDERVAITIGQRSRLPVIVAVHSTVLGQAVGGCRLWRYPDWRDGLEDALRLSEAMTLKCALAGLSLGGGKTVIAMAPETELTADRRRAAMLDLGDAVDALDGCYGVGEDVGTTAEDMLIARDARGMRTACRPPRAAPASPPYRRPRASARRSA